MDHDWSLLGVVAVDVLHIEPLGEVVVQLDGGALPLPPDGILQHEEWRRQRVRDKIHNGRGMINEGISPFSAILFQKIL